MNETNDKVLDLQHGLILDDNQLTILNPFYEPTSGYRRSLPADFSPEE